ncbi:hypothetical protein N7462_006917 [Penicillium macrosclerotiorum]|uniref:uncharacterized protein n=1 Tax=Penicillium macrosclerotiorum TaxID=303699 RepID=UPI002547EAB1|nr:uncharacterized protein N7462_006917 [Penicillium macrosclerotiorum]KAJ5678673.1 hypothetical protein N7462_006917 [Penicillium macrosclerotiorum]
MRFNRFIDRGRELAAEKPGDVKMQDEMTVGDEGVKVWGRDTDRIGTRWGGIGKLDPSKPRTGGFRSGASQPERVADENAETRREETREGKTARSTRLRVRTVALKQLSNGFPGLGGRRKGVREGKKRRGEVEKGAESIGCVFGTRCLLGEARTGGRES